jgi:hypothetical protein
MTRDKSEEKRGCLWWKGEFGWAQVLAIIAIGLSIIMPFLAAVITYEILAVRLERQKNVMALELENQKSKLAELREDRKSRPQLLISNVKKSSDEKESLSFEVANVGQSPAKELQIIVWSTAYDSLSKATDKKEAIRNHVLIYPGIQFDPELEGGVIPTIRITFKRPLAPQEKLSVTLFEIPTSVSIQNQYGELTPVFASGGI